MMMWNDGYWGSGAGAGGWVMLVFMILFVVATIVAIVALVRYLGQPSAGAAPTAYGPAQATGNVAEAPKDILKRRYAAGEIERDEYLQKLGDL